MSFSIRDGLALLSLLARSPWSRFTPPSRLGEVFSPSVIAGNPDAPVNRGLPRLLHPVFDAADHAVAEVLGQTTIGGLARAMLTRAS